MGWLRCFTNHSICRSLADHSCLRHSSFDPLSAIAHSRNTVSSHEPETPGLRELAASWRPEENPCQSGFFSESLFFAGPAVSVVAWQLISTVFKSCLQFHRARSQRHFRSPEGVSSLSQGRLVAISTPLRPPKSVESK